MEKKAKKVYREDASLGLNTGAIRLKDSDPMVIAWLTRMRFISENRCDGLWNVI